MAGSIAELGKMSGMNEAEVTTLTSQVVKVQDVVSKTDVFAKCHEMSQKKVWSLDEAVSATQECLNRVYSPEGRRRKSFIVNAIKGKVKTVSHAQPGRDNPVDGIVITVAFLMPVEGTTSVMSDLDFSVNQKRGGLLFNKPAKVKAKKAYGPRPIPAPQKTSYNSTETLFTAQPTASLASGGLKPSSF